MSNIIRFNDKTPVDDWLCMSNGATDVFINILVLSGSALAETEDEKQMIVWLSEKDQHTLGFGTVGFDVVHMPWSNINFASVKSFMLRVVDGALLKLNWNRLDYPPNEELVMPFLEKFKQYIDRMSEDDILENKRVKWLNTAEKDNPIKCGFPYCKKHGTLLSLFGCNLCNN